MVLPSRTGGGAPRCSRARFARTVAALGCLCLAAGGLGVSSRAQQAAGYAEYHTLTPITPAATPPWSPPASPGEVELGARLFDDPRLSHDDRISCSSCHDLDAAGADGLRRNLGGDGRPLDRNTPTVFNAAANFRLNWAGEYGTLEEQAAAILTNPRVMGTSPDEVTGKLGADPWYAQRFRAVYGTGPSLRNVAAALAAFQRTLVTVGSRFDRYLEGDALALTAAEAEGFQLFVEIGCVSCHQGRNAGGNLLQRFGLFAAHRGVRGDGEDPGLMGHTGREADRHVFRVPSLRNVAVTPPYFHDGSAPSLAAAVGVMARSQLGRSLDDKDVERIVAFLGTLTGTFHGRPLRPSGAPPA